MDPEIDPLKTMVTEGEIEAANDGEGMGPTPRGCVACLVRTGHHRLYHNVCANSSEAAPQTRTVVQERWKVRKTFV